MKAFRSLLWASMPFFGVAALYVAMETGHIPSLFLIGLGVAVTINLLRSTRHYKEWEF